MMNFDHALVEVILGLRDLAWNRGACAALTNIEFCIEVEYGRLTLKVDLSTKVHGWMVHVGM
jgi:hypothetical protein